MTQPSGRSVPVHAHTAPVEQQRAAKPFAGSAVYRPTHRGRKRDEDDTAALTPHSQYLVTVLFPEVFDVSADGLENA